MFNFFKSSKRKRLEMAVEQVGICVAQVRAQLGFAEEMASRLRLETLFGYGYIFGFADALFIRWGVERDSERLGNVLAVFHALLGVETGGKAFDKCLASQSGEYFVRGRLMGGQEAFDWTKSRGEQVPMGLAQFLLSGATNHAPG